MHKQDTDRKYEWLQLAKDLMLKCVERDSVFSHELCPSTYSNDEADKKKSLKRVADLSREISTLAGRLAILERDGSIGAKALGIDDEIARTVIAILVIARLGGCAAYEVRKVSAVIDLVGGREPSRCLAIRNLFREDGLLFKHIYISLQPALDDCRSVIRESAFNKVLGQNSDESETVCNAAAMMGRWER